MKFVKNLGVMLLAVTLTVNVSMGGAAFADEPVSAKNKESIKDESLTVKESSSLPFALPASIGLASSGLGVWAMVKGIKQKNKKFKYLGGALVAVGMLDLFLSFRGHQASNKEQDLRQPAQSIENVHLQIDKTIVDSDTKPMQIVEEKLFEDTLKDRIQERKESTELK